MSRARIRHGIDWLEVTDEDHRADTAAHPGLFDPAGAADDAEAAAAAALAAHVAAGDPHPGYVLESELGVSVATLVAGTVPSAQIPAIAITEFLGTVASQAAMLALSGQKGDWCVRSDLGKVSVITGADPTQLSDWTLLTYPAAPVTSVNGQAGVVVLGYADVGADAAGAAAAAQSAAISTAASDATSKANAAQAAAVQRSNHIGTQLSATISDFAATVRSTLLTGLSLATSQVIAATDTVLAALGYLQAQITALTTAAVPDSSDKRYVTDAQRTTIAALGTVSALASDTDTTLAANSDSRVATQKAVKTYVDNAVTGLWEVKGSTDCSGNPNYPAASKGDAYAVTIAGKIGGASGATVDIGDVYVALLDNAGGTEAAVGTSWFHLEHNLVGAVLTGGALGTPSSGNLANCTFPTLNQNTTGSSASCTGNAATVTTNANLTGDVTSVGNAATLATTQGAVHTWTLTQTFTAGASIASAGTLDWNSDTYVTRRGAANPNFGAADSATPMAQTISFQGARGGTDSNTAAVDTTFKGSLGTGTGAAGKFIFKVGTAQATGSTAHVSNTALTLQDSGTGGTSLPQVVLSASTSVASPPLSFSGDLDTGFAYASANTFNVITNGAKIIQYFSGGWDSYNGANIAWRFASQWMDGVASSMLRWSPTTVTVSPDLGFGRNAAGVAEVTNGTTGTFRDLIVRTLMIGGVEGGANSVVQKLASASSIANATATTVFTITIPNAAHSASVRIKLVGSLGAGGAIGANEATGSIEYDVSIARTAGVNAVANISAAFGSTTSSVAGAATITVAGTLPAVSGAVGASNTIAIQVTITRGSGSSANHTCKAFAELVNANATGITIA